MNDDEIIADFRAIVQSRQPVPVPANETARRSHYKALNRRLLGEAVETPTDTENAPEIAEGSADDATG